jgi:hypothetical protein
MLDCDARVLKSLIVIQAPGKRVRTTLGLGVGSK